MLKCGALSPGVFLNKEEGASFYRWRGGGSFEKCLIPIWKEKN
jgi:hypothetical protein